MTAYAQPAAVQGAIFTRPVRALTALAVIGIGLVVWRFVVGLGQSTALNDGYPWGLWIAFDVVTGTSLACGGYALVLLVYVMNRGQYHPLVRAATVTSAFGYSIAGFSVVIDIGRPWLAWKLPLFWHWNLRSVLLEVALCILTYTIVLWIELAPAFLERAQASTIPWIRQLAKTWLPVLRRMLVWVAALGVLLPTMHQSGLGTLLLLSGPRLHPLWNTIMLPLLFLTSCIAMGFGVVVLESALSSRLLGRRPEMEMLAGLGAVIRPVLHLYLGVRLVDLIVRKQINQLFAFDSYSVMSLIEFALFFGALALLREERQRRDPRTLFRAAMLMLLGGALYRFDVFLIAFQPGPQWTYFPSVTEILVSTGLVAAEVVGYIVLIMRFPILAGAPAAAPAS
ncbi:MAG TPA: Ni/Fe-hydrogenase cytochrome b subunit [Candidatus Acidoferrales bacterium]|nr:Ni/Fe-hydrogenase cytochrome b subunit [Candidatus Acidoferrales bacterium]